MPPLCLSHPPYILQDYSDSEYSSSPSSSSYDTSRNSGYPLHTLNRATGRAVCEAHTSNHSASAFLPVAVCSNTVTQSPVNEKTLRITGANAIHPSPPNRRETAPLLIQGPEDLGRDGITIKAIDESSEEEDYDDEEDAREGVDTRHDDALKGMNNWGLMKLSSV